MNHKRDSHHPLGVLAEVLRRSLEVGTLQAVKFLCRNSESTCPQAVRSDGNLPRDEKEAEIHVLLKHVQLAANITEMPGGMCERQLIMPRPFTSPPAGYLTSSILDIAVSSSFPSRPISQIGNSWLRQSQAEMRTISAASFDSRKGGRGVCLQSHWAPCTGVGAALGLRCQGKLDQSPLSKLHPGRAMPGQRRRLAWGRTLLQHASVACAQNLPSSKAFPGTLYKQSFCSEVESKISAEEEVLAFWIKGIHGISTKKSGQSPLALPKTPPSTKQASARPWGVISSNMLWGWGQGNFKGLLLLV